MKKTPNFASSDIYLSSKNAINEFYYVVALDQARNLDRRGRTHYTMEAFVVPAKSRPNERPLSQPHVTQSGHS